MPMCVVRLTFARPGVCSASRRARAASEERKRPRRPGAGRRNQSVGRAQGGPSRPRRASAAPSSGSAGRPRGAGEARAGRDLRVRRGGDDTEEAGCQTGGGAAGAGARRARATRDGTLGARQNTAASIAPRARALRWSARRPRYRRGVGQGLSCPRVASAIGKRGARAGRAAKGESSMIEGVLSRRPAKKADQCLPRRTQRGSMARRTPSEARHVLTRAFRIEDVGRAGGRGMACRARAGAGEREESERSLLSLSPKKGRRRWSRLHALLVAPRHGTNEKSQGGVWGWRGQGETSAKDLRTERRRAAGQRRRLFHGSCARRFARARARALASRHRALGGGGCARRRANTRQAHQVKRT
jgi:hypothetical protein